MRRLTLVVFKDSNLSPAMPTGESRNLDSDSPPSESESRILNGALGYMCPGVRTLTFVTYKYTTLTLEVDDTRGATIRVLLALAGFPTGLYRPVARRYRVESVVYR